jgi:hypothetical protein
MDKMIERLFEKFESIYGEKFRRMWENTDPEMMNATWATALGSFERKHIVQAIGYLEQDNPYPPTLPEFTVLCKRAKGSQQPMYQPAPKLPAPDFSDATEAAKQRCLAMLESLTFNNRPSYDWAHRLKARERSGEKLAQSQKSMLAQFERESGITL